MSTSKSTALQVQWWPLDRPIPYARNARVCPEAAIAKVAGSIKEFGFKNPILVDAKGVIIAGHTRLLAAQRLGLDAVPVIVCTDLSWAQVKALRLADNRTSLETCWDDVLLALELEELIGLDFDLDVTGFDEDEIAALLDIGNGEADGAGQSTSLAERFLVPPFSVLDSRQGYWQERKRAWMSLGIDGSCMRGETKTSGSLSGTVPGYYGYKARAEKEIGGELSHAEFQSDHLARFLPAGGALRYTDSGGILSVFDPVLCEVVYAWFSPPGGMVLDPFAGGSVRGIVASCMGRRYLGIDLMADQVEDNRRQAAGLCGDPLPEWIAGDSRDLDDLDLNAEADLVFSCPPYADLERYSDDPADLSTMAYEDFLTAYRAIIRRTLRRLRLDRFACFVVGDVRDRRGFYRDFVSNTIAAFEVAGAKLYNEAILVTMPGSMPLRVGGQFTKSRKIGKTHQNVLVFCKGNPRRAAVACGPVEVAEVAAVAAERLP